MLYGAFLALRQTDFKMVLAYSSVSHMGIVLIGLGSLTEAGIQGAIFQAVSHGFIAAFLFFLVGVMYERTRTTTLARLGGLAKTMPYVSGFILAGAMASLGLPGTSGFISEFMAFVGAFQAEPLLAAIGTLGIIMTAVYLLRAVLGMTFGQTTVTNVPDLRGMEWVPAISLLLLIIIIGVYPNVLAMPLQTTIETMMNGLGVDEMDFETLLSYEWGVMMPEFIILGVAVALSLIDLFMPENRNRQLLGLFAFVGVAVSFVSLLGLWTSDVTSILGDTFRLDSFAKSFKALLLIGSALVLLLSIHYEPKERIAYRGEFYYLFLTALLGAMMMASSGDLITLFVGLELLSISSYILVAIRKKHTLANEAALKYVITGGIATAITLFGMSYIFGFTGSTNIKEIAVQLASTYDENHQYILSLAFLLTFVGLSFKLASAPFHMWAPDVYQGATTLLFLF
ncbi:NADH-quinone oxidoreductase subunit M [Anoxybacillus sp. BCO1]|nr:NADH-quinone oxidoreductase subunit M [Anoxybacillus sp. BCO1]